MVVQSASIIVATPEPNIAVVEALATSIDVEMIDSTVPVPDVTQPSLETQFEGSPLAPEALTPLLLPAPPTLGPTPMEAKSLAARKISRTSKESAENSSREDLDVLTSKMDTVGITLDDDIEDLKQAKLDQEVAHEHMKMAEEQA
ncbi:hypothetical protein H6P81_002692 [Aristolochia fimbriata]|uniref:Uncharacterized protein n=1 Tax=Aristolochia fimbriata TaxID=158543 RepID=A0AAV7FC89_ARIFI|nr:hypothetical protein H6P81_002692 [Aristolochia fimbriata]